MANVFISIMFVMAMKIVKMGMMKSLMIVNFRNVQIKVNSHAPQMESVLICLYIVMVFLTVKIVMTKNSTAHVIIQTC